MFDSVKEETEKMQKQMHFKLFAQHMMETSFNDLLDLSKLDSSDFKLEEDYFNLPLTIN